MIGSPSGGVEEDILRGAGQMSAAKQVPDITEQMLREIAAECLLEEISGTDIRNNPEGVRSYAQQVIGYFAPEGLWGAYLELLDVLDEDARLRSGAGILPTEITSQHQPR